MSVVPAALPLDALDSIELSTPNGTKGLFNVLGVNPAQPMTGITTVRAMIAMSTIMLARQQELDDEFSWNQAQNTVATSKYDYIIAGGGTAGCVLANRLATAGKKVLVLEAGLAPLETNYIPALGIYNLNHPSTEWMYNSVPQKYSGLGNPDKRLRLAVGKSLGGSSNLNWMIYMRGNPNDYNNWAEILNDTTWRFDELLPYFKKMENYHGNFPSKFHGVRGPLYVNKEAREPLLREWMIGGDELGYHMRDPNGQDQTASFFPIDVNIKNGRRFPVYDAYLKPVLELPNLRVVKRALVNKILFNDELEATGVRFSKGGKSFDVMATEEVIICAGGLGTPQILQRSGIGPSDLLKKLGITQIANLPGVGENLQDHPNTALGPFIINDTLSFHLDRDMPEATVMYSNNRNGPYAWNMLSGLAFINTSGYPSDWPNIQLYNVPIAVGKTFAKDVSSLFGIAEDKFKKYVKEVRGKDATSVLLSMARTKSIGKIQIISADPNDAPKIDPNYYSDPDDVKAMVEGMEFARKMIETSEVWQRYDARLHPKPMPGCEKDPVKSNEYYECYMRQFTSTTWHFSGTAKMGTDQDNMAVLDNRLRVRNVKRLRVVDASVFPVIPAANTHVPVIMTAERAADFILKKKADNEDE